MKFSDKYEKLEELKSDGVGILFKARKLDNGQLVEARFFHSDMATEGKA